MLRRIIEFAQDQQCIAPIVVSGCPSYRVSARINCGQCILETLGCLSEEVRVPSDLSEPLNCCAQIILTSRPPCRIGAPINVSQHLLKDCHGPFERGTITT